MLVVHILAWLLNQTSLPTYLRSDFVVWKTCGGKYGDLLASRDRVHRVDRGNTGRNHLFGVHLVFMSILPSILVPDAS